MKSLEAIFGPNSALVDELYKQYKEDPDSVPGHWKRYFDELEGIEIEEAPTQDNGAPAVKEKKKEAPKKEKPAEEKKEPKIPEGAEVEKIKGVASKIVENMDESVYVPTATSLRVLPVKMMTEDRKIINSHLLKTSNRKASFTHLIAWAVIQALKEFPNINSYYANKNGDHYRIKPGQVNLGIAVDLESKDGSRNLVVPNIKNVDEMNFSEFLDAYSELIEKARSGNLEISDFDNTTISVTNPGTIGTVSSVPRLMKGQGAIIATGAINYPAEFQSMAQDVLNQLGVSKVMTMTCTYDHRVIQGAESGMFLQHVHNLLNGKEDFYEKIFSDLDIPYEPFPYGEDKYGGQLGGRGNTLEQDRRAIAVWRLINLYRLRGHVLADLDPLGTEPGQGPELDLEYYGLTLWDLDREFFCDGLGGKKTAKLRDIIQLLRETYCGKIGAEYMHLLDLEERKWLRETMESTTNTPDLTKDDKEDILHKLNQAMAFEQFLHKKYVGHKRFSLEGAETLIPMMHFLMEHGVKNDVKKFFLGMAHRGRLNILVNIMNKPYRKVFADFEGNVDPDTIQGSGDVKYHLGSKGSYKINDEESIELELMPNPSHLEAVNPIVEGAARASQDHYDDDEARKKIVPILMHGDAAFAGQGVVAETLNMSQLRAYETGGTIHFIINNQIGFTTLPKDARSTEYASDLAKMILAPIFHVNGDDPEAAVHAINLAMDYRQKFGKDVVIDLICYRKHGHNEGDEPAFTQPGLYKEIENHPTVRDIYVKELLRKGEFTEEETQAIFDEFDELLQQAFEDAKSSPSLEVTDKMLKRSEKEQNERDEFPDTTYEIEELKDIAVQLNTVPKDFDANPKLLRQLAKRAEAAQNNDKKIDWGFAEALAFGSLLKSGRTVRLVGQDAERGTFSHRHAVLHGTQTAQRFTPLNHLSDDQGDFYPFNSLLSEFAALGFEFGYSSAIPEALVIWEAQFGDFVNGAQVIIDQFISASEEKWGQKSALVMTLPHGYEGQGPEHSSARLERFLQLCAEDNMQVANLTTPTQYFHILRKQTLQEKKKPLIIMSPKSLLRHPMAVCTVEELANGAFQPFLADPEVEDKESIDRLIICSGKVYYDLYKAREESEKNNIAIGRIEQFYPFPDEDIENFLQEYKHVKEVIWCQEEPKNMGAWNFLFPRLQALLQDGQTIRYAGRQAAASTAAGQKKIHDAEQERLVSEALRLD
ncbi:multifunctional oxoglutarate decarboxylase/oxoglutarate dehydrogenase thiamine pyrophosphate-binding subunit/dihydrolipoyllysine-residue succinyltransferase subunit [Rhodohalobacter sulfatireducens]|uniref:oxoglutarate dehydrogenase (succinyl-transferring) n=1 Tax=Rhodohalobacter sulfatireducens TaxID=2911366 RepID=A0ABS9KBQ7_9BACT|nr:multifunctional oxoglutarate decarboxylase/oxoglutarate dehydrogenase thiamine pyrophosphate-binding subunit/dihydrolipoyllysine-residue succinyltransferase subunit [Rhodohalobacter sulfatireducens]MCG2588282.1 multifunctional oxoglutarate decarboxylase/oxoglutarate dehydrogenase thiamine pyrophosphate-binding subunit/dihydrolipoyllysine-residue succinyltransferase subunit [Rhodohalobacter sulfatireducens]